MYMRTVDDTVLLRIFFHSSLCFFGSLSFLHEKQNDILENGSSQLHHKCFLGASKEPSKTNPVDKFLLVRKQLWQSSFSRLNNRPDFRKRYTAPWVNVYDDRSINSVVKHVAQNISIFHSLNGSFTTSTSI